MGKKHGPGHIFRLLFLNNKAEPFENKNPVLTAWPQHTAQYPQISHNKQGIFYRDDLSSPKIPGRIEEVSNQSKI